MSNVKWKAVQSSSCESVIASIFEFNSGQLVLGQGHMTFRLWDCRSNKTVIEVPGYWGLL